MEKTHHIAVATALAQIADTTKAVADCRAGLSDEPVASSSDQFLDSLLSQLAALKEELASVFVDGGPERIERELALARRAAARVQKGVVLCIMPLGAKFWTH